MTGTSLPCIRASGNEMRLMRVRFLSWYLVPSPLQEKHLALRTGHPNHVACSNFPGPNLCPAPNDAAGNRIEASLWAAAQTMAARLAVGA